ncbi:tyrosine-type recombinase/integrase [[Clostridium] symbiosum]|uniref:tyrosine-type recombinase/integrase n=1 Tax=Clostridium symbiosum TaxID=1512 RepID=UPI001C03A182|nr:tyrosine-type recombinase/integrase [[Clostridium] symbiosum]MBT9784022.1 tyrosine-type recombinase/integrase [[Clostridium] symbiosum]DAL80556.1 MAG TPA: Integrase [Caudoviricetes sp.]
MATAVPYKDKDGNVVSYQIQVFRGRDSSGKKLKPYTTSWKIPETYKSEKAIKKALEKAMGEFESECKKGNVAVDRSTLSEYCRHYIELKGSNKKKSVAFYNSLLPRIDDEIGHIRLDQLNANHLDKFYLKLQKEGRRDTKAVAKENLIAERNKQKLTNKAISDLTGLTPTTVGIAMKQRHVNLSTAEKLSAALGKKVSALFDIVILGEQDGLSAKTINHYHTFIHSVLQTAYKKGSVPTNVADRATVPTVQKKEAEFFEIDEIIQIRTALERYPFKYRVMICLLVDTGIRRGELFGLRWSSINFEQQQILIDRNIQWVKGAGLYADSPKGRKSRLISISDEMAALLKEYRAAQAKELELFGIPGYNEEEYLFIQSNGKVMNPSSLNHWCKRFELAEGLPHIYPHKFRHSQASILFYSGIDIMTVSGRMGHAQASTTGNIYGHVLKTADRGASDALANALYRNHG